MSSLQLTFRIVLGTIGLTGTLTNILMLYCLFKVEIASHLSAYLLRTQCLIDSYTCFVVFIHRLVGDSISTGLPVLDKLLCYIWYGDGLFKFGAVFSIQNLVCISFERLCAVLQPVIYKTHPMRLTIICYTYLIVMSLYILIPSYLLRRYETGRCRFDTNEESNAMGAFIRVQFYLWLILNHLFPTFFLIGSHVVVIRVAQRPVVNKSSGLLKWETKSVRRRVRRLTRATTLMATALTLLHLSSTIQYILFITKIVPHIHGTWSEQANIALFEVASTLNPCVLVAMIRSLRRNWRSIVFCRPIAGTITYYATKQNNGDF
ncbi:uncharacterized protein DEA37_0010256 [Paragonimus westermani]|uniref:G-protein coupled receptors family 1 profile domain-containing protein n=1 Tax=Paragonimus westermani TaxID=34504 RepID=A0A5J4NXT9_9TREM|nr:uncharacterized protein DEA37_0010256 [Paragonimus westermani]